MNREQFNESMKRVLAFTQSPKNAGEVQHLQNYMNGLYEAVGDMDAYIFEKVTVELCKNMSRGQRPMPGQFRAIYYRLRDEQRAGQPVKVCPSCNNTIWLMVRMMETKTGEEKDFAKPCPECQIKHPFKDAPPRDGWILVERKGLTHDEQMLQQAKTMGAKGARFVLDMIERKQARFSDEVILELVLRAGDTPNQENKPLENVLAGLRPSEPQREQVAPLQAESDVSLQPVTTSAQPMVAEVPKVVVVNGEEYEVET